LGNSEKVRVLAELKQLSPRTTKELVSFWLEICARTSSYHTSA